MDATYSWLTKTTFLCNNSPFINLDMARYRQELSERGTSNKSLADGYNVVVGGIPNYGIGAWRSTAPTTAGALQGTLKAVDGLPAMTALRAKLEKPADFDWVLATAGSGATICVVAKMPATAAANQALLDFSPMFVLVRQGADLAVTVDGKKGLVKGAFDNKWHSYVTVTSGTKTVVYVDNVSRVTVNHDSLADTFAKVHFLGAPSTSASSQLSGNVRQLLVWRRVLGGGELGVLHNNLKAAWKL
jgi:hypothetical protein